MSSYILEEMLQYSQLMIAQCTHMQTFKYIHSVNDDTSMKTRFMHVMSCQPLTVEISHMLVKYYTMSNTVLCVQF